MSKLARILLCAPPAGCHTQTDSKILPNIELPETAVLRGAIDVLYEQGRMHTTIGVCWPDYYVDC
jgi:hypothetical protein